MSTDPAMTEADPVVVHSDDRVTVSTPDSELRHPWRLVANIFRDLWAGRELAWRMFLRNIRGLYRQTFFGLFWAFLPPLANTLVWVILRRANAIDLAKNLPAGISPDQFSYAAYVMTGMVIWQSFVEALQGPLQAVQSNRNMLGKLKFPRESILLVKFMEVLFNLGMRIVVLVPLLLIMPTQPLTTEVFWVPVLVLLFISFGFAIGLFLMPFGMLYQDVGRALQVIVPVWMILTPIIYLPPQGWANSPLNYLNPAGPLLSVARDLVVFGQSEYWTNAIPYMVIALPLLMVGLILFRLAMPVLVERISN